METEEKEIQNSVLISNKPISIYILAANRIKDRFEEITLKARGKNINTLVSVAEILKRNGMKLKDIKIGTETFKSEKNEDIMVSSMEIILIK